MASVTTQRPTSWQKSSPEELLAIHNALWNGSPRVKFRSTSYYVHTEERPKKHFRKVYIGPYAFITQNVRKESPWSKEIKEFNETGGKMCVTWICLADQFVYLGRIVTKVYADGTVHNNIVAFNNPDELIYDSRTTE